MLANGGALMAMIREELTFSSDGERHATLGYTLLQAPGPRPIIVMAHGLTGTLHLWILLDTSINGPFLGTEGFRRSLAANFSLGRY